MVARGDADLCVLPTSEILPVPGLDLLGSFPDDVRGYLVMVAGIGARATSAEAARSFIAFLTSPAAAPVLARKGMERE
jgi:molybdate transport system substrate-binding protein